MTRHPFDPVSFSGGLALLGLGLVGAFGGFSNLDSLRIGWPILLMLVGIVLVGSAAGSALRKDPAVTASTDGHAEPELGADSPRSGSEVSGSVPSWTD